MPYEHHALPAYMRVWSYHPLPRPLLTTSPYGLTTYDHTIRTPCHYDVTITMPLVAASLTRTGNYPALRLQGYIKTMKTDFGNIDLTDTWLDQARDLETARNIIDMEALSAKSNPPLHA